MQSEKVTGLKTYTVTFMESREISITVDHDNPDESLSNAIFDIDSSKAEYIGDSFEVIDVIDEDTGKKVHDWANR